jgi:TonB family protein
VDLPVLNALSPEDLAKLLTDGPTSGGPGPAAQPTPVPPSAAATVPEPPKPVQPTPPPAQRPTPPEPRSTPPPRQPEPEPEPAPKAPATRQTRKPEPEPDAEIPTARNATETTIKPEKNKKPTATSTKPKEAPKREINLTAKTKIDGKAAAEARERAQREADAREQEQAAMAQAQARRRELLSGIQGSIANVATSTARGVGSVSFTGGGGGQAAINYGEYIVAEFKRSWVAPNTDNSSLTAKATVTIASDGRVTEARVVSRSGDAAFDKSVEAVLKRVRKVAGFPTGASSAPRTYTISFKPDSSKGLG